MVIAEAKQRFQTVGSRELKKERFVCIIIEVDADNALYCGKNCIYRNQHPVSPRCSNPLFEDGHLQWDNNFSGLKRCPRCISLYDIKLENKPDV